MNKKVTPPLKWAGGKRWLVPELVKIYSKFHDYRLVEPFVGGLAVSLGLQPKKALLNDINPHLINFYKQLKKGLVSQIELQYDREFYDKLRSKFNRLIENNLINTKEAALIFYYLNRSGFNGLCRFNSSGLFNVPFGKYKTVNYISDFTEFKKVFKNWKFTYTDFEKLEIEKSDFLYVDPPYDVQFTKYSKQDFNWEDQERLIDWLKKKKNPIVLSNQATDRILDLYRKAGFKTRIISAPRKISSDGNRDNVDEVLAFKNL